MIGPCDEGDATGRGQPVKSTLDPLEPTLDVALNDFGGVWSQYPKVPRTTRRAGKRVGHNEYLLAIGGRVRHPSRRRQAPDRQSRKPCQRYAAGRHADPRARTGGALVGTAR